MKTFFLPLIIVTLATPACGSESDGEALGVPAGEAQGAPAEPSVSEGTAPAASPEVDGNRSPVEVPPSTMPMPEPAQMPPPEIPPVEMTPPPAETPPAQVPPVEMTPPPEIPPVETTPPAEMPSVPVPVEVPMALPEVEPPPAPMLTDADLDGVMSDLDCDDNDAATFPGVREGCNEKDNDCNGNADNDCIDLPRCEMKEFQGVSYAFCDDPLPLPDARDQCHILGMETVAINSAEENAWVNNNNSNADTWIGATDSADINVAYRMNQEPRNPTEGTFRWLMGDVEFWRGGNRGEGGQPVEGIYVNWGGTNLGLQPNNVEALKLGPLQTENCVVIRKNSDAKWFDIGCTNRVGRATCETRN